MGTEMAEPYLMRRSVRECT